VQNKDNFLQKRIHVFCITGLKDASYAGTFHLQHADGTTTQVLLTPFRDDMEVVMSAADLAVARAGAGTIAEFTAIKLPMVLLPYPHAADDHQTANARFVEQQGSGLLLSDDKIHTLFDEVTHLIHNTSLLEKFQENLRRFHHPDITTEIVLDLEKMSACAHDRQLSNISSFS
jgi:UDP-N-acetylglucosamine--N-acetylmuramyl-(pentapeptide) pyrophosphoryl-undecaprenol N-acetylglucosamine transferase